MASKKSPAPQTAEKAPEQQQDQSDQITIVGRLVADPELRYTKTSGKAVSNIRIAVNNDGEDATFHNIVVWGRTAEVVCQYLKKGRAVEATGCLQERTYLPEEGDARQVVELVARTVQFLGRQAKQEEREVA